MPTVSLTRLTSSAIPRAWITRCLPLLVVGVLAAGCANSSGNANNNDGGGNTNENNNNNNTPILDRFELGFSCEQSGECISELCLSVGQQFLCSKDCDAPADCPQGFYCARVDVTTAPNGEDIPPTGGYCLPDRGGLCKPCGSDINCTFAGDKCLDLGDGNRVCGRDCTVTQDCPVGFNCQGNQCWPVANTCDCVTERMGATKPCQIVNQYGACLGVETCSASGIWDECNANIPTSEVCNGRDDNCDGILPTDELDLDENGQIDCMSDCVDPSPETCNGLDDNCNMDVDEGDPEDLCGVVANGTPQCLHGLCLIDDCDAGWGDVDGDMANGCECQLVSSGGGTCQVAEVVGPLDDAGAGSSELRQGILEEGNEAWYYVQLTDTPDGLGACDNFHARVHFVTNPDSAYVFDVISELCGGGDLCANNSVTDFEWYTDFLDPVSLTGECNCGDPADLQDGETECVDNTQVVIVKVYRQQGADLACTPYELEFSNGVYDAP